MRTVSPILKWALVLVVLAVIVIDAGYYVTTMYRLSETTRVAAVAAAQQASYGEDEDTAYQAAEDVASAEGVDIYGYEQSGDTVRLWTETGLDGTVLFGPVLQMIQDRDPPVLRYDLTRTYDTGA